jgi:hypothetical protein
VERWVLAGVEQAAELGVLAGVVVLVRGAEPNQVTEWKL